MPPRKVLNVAIKKPINEEVAVVDTPVNILPEVVIPEVVPEVVPASIEAPKKKSKSPEHLANLQKGRDKLKQINEEKRIAKQALAQAALEKKVARAIEEKKKIQQQYGVSSDEEVESVPAPLPVKKKALAPLAPPTIKKKKIRYVEVEESSSEEEEEIVYYKPAKAPTAKKVVANKTRFATAERASPAAPQIIFY